MTSNGLLFFIIAYVAICWAHATAFAMESMKSIEGRFIALIAYLGAAILGAAIPIIQHLQP